MESNHNQMEDISNHPLISWFQNYQTKNQQAITYYSAWYPEVPKNQITFTLKTDQILKVEFDIGQYKDISILGEINLGNYNNKLSINICDFCHNILPKDKTELSRNNIREFFYSENLKEESKFALPSEMIEKICDYVNLKVNHNCLPKLYGDIIGLGGFKLFNTIPHNALLEDFQSNEDVIVAQYYPEWHQHESEMQYKIVGAEAQLALPWE